MYDESYNTFYQLDLVHWFPAGRRKILRGLLARHASHVQPRIADVGCGTGANLNMLSTLGTVVGLDFSYKAISFCRQLHINRTAVARLPHLPLSDESFDLACAIDVIEHLDNDVAAVQELVRVLRRGGTLLLTVPAYNWLWSRHDDANLHKRRYTRSRLRTLMRAVPVDVLQLTHFNTLLSSPIIAVRLLQKLRDHFQPPNVPELDLRETSPLLNALLFRLLSAEAQIVKRLSLPFGISIACVARKH